MAAWTSTTSSQRSSSLFCPGASCASATGSGRRRNERPLPDRSADRGRPGRLPVRRSSPAGAFLMTTNGLLQIFLFIALLVAVARPLGAYMARIYENRSFGRVERLIYKVCGVRPEEEMDWKGYALAVLLFSAVGVIALYAQQRVQAWLPL